jgi:uncharacterized cupin superfamily protein
MQKMIFSNVKNAEFKNINLNKAFEPDKQHKQSFEFQKCNVSNPYSAKEGKLAVSFYTLQPGKANYPYHYHMGSEEVFYIISGKGTLKTPDGEKAVSEGDVIVCPANENGAHMIINTSDTPLMFLDVDTVSLDSAEVVAYPDTEKYLIKSKKGEILDVFMKNTSVNYLNGE